MEDTPGYKVCQHCLEFHKILFPAWPGDPSWRLNHGAIDRNVWGIRADMIKTRDIENVSELQVSALRAKMVAITAEYYDLSLLRSFEQGHKAD
jgi:hypothetical protein